MADRFPLSVIPVQVAEIAGRLRSAGYDAWYVGGAIRDELIRQQLHRRDLRRGDFDIATSARPEQVQALFRRTVPVGIEHGTVAVLDKENRGHEVTTFRRDVKTDGRHAEVEFGVSLEEDLARRDFTINAIAVHPESGEMRDPFHGRPDLAANIVRAVGDPATRFREDRLRVLRGLRFAASFGFTIEAGTLDALKASASELEHLSRERVRDEWLKMLSIAAPSLAVGRWREAGVLVPVWPELASLPEKAIAELDEVVGIGTGDGVLVTAAAMVRAGLTPAVAGAAAERLRFSNKDRERVEGILEALAAGAPDPHNPPALRRWMSRHLAVAADAACVAALDSHERTQLKTAVKEMLALRSPLSIGDLAIKGDDLRKAGVPAGPAMGVVLRALLDAVLEDPRLNTREKLLARIPKPETA